MLKTSLIIFCLLPILFGYPVELAEPLDTFSNMTQVSVNATIDSEIICIENSARFLTIILVLSVLIIPIILISIYLYIKTIKEVNTTQVTLFIDDGHSFLEDLLDDKWETLSEF